MKNSVKLEADLSGTGTPVLLLHGFPDSRKLWHPITPFFIAKNYQVIAPDLRGFGDSPIPPNKQQYKINVVIEDIIALLKAHKIKRPIHIIGHDLGAVLGWCFALAHPELVKSLVAVSVGHPKAYARAGWRQKLKGLYVLGFQFPRLTEYMLARNDFYLLRKWARQHPLADEAIQAIAPTGRLTAGLNYYRANIVAILLKSWSNCKIPVLGIWSTKDSFLSEDQMRDSEKYKDANWKFVKIEGGGHWLPIDEAAQLFKLADDWFQKQS